MRSKWMPLLLALSLGCGRVKDPTPKGTVLVEWDRSSARLHDPSDVTKEGPKHPIADAKVVEGPITHKFFVRMLDVEDKPIAFDVEVDASKVEYDESGRSVSRWATSRVSVKLVENEAFRITGSCDNRVASVMGAIGEVTNTMMDCRVVAKRPNSMGNVDAITTGVWMQIEGSGKVLVSDPKVKVEEK